MPFLVFGIAAGIALVLVIAGTAWGNSWDSQQ